MMGLLSKRRLTPFYIFLIIVGFSTAKWIKPFGQVKN
jgi:hypothetical protein